MKPHLQEDVSPQYIIIDCRYPYEYAGGHIQGALNLYTKEQVIDFLRKQHEKISASVAPPVQSSGNPATAMKNPATSDAAPVDDRTLGPMDTTADPQAVAMETSMSAEAPETHAHYTAPGLIFHCEFSSKRGPLLAQFLRGQDREINRYDTHIHTRTHEQLTEVCVSRVDGLAQRQQVSSHTHHSHTHTHKHTHTHTHQLFLLHLPYSPLSQSHPRKTRTQFLPGRPEGRVPHA